MDEQTRKNLQAILDKVIYHIYTDKGWILLPYSEIECRYCGQHFRSECVREERTNL